MTPYALCLFRISTLSFPSTRDSLVDTLRRLMICYSRHKKQSADDFIRILLFEAAKLEAFVYQNDNVASMEVGLNRLRDEPANYFVQDLCLILT